MPNYCHNDLYINGPRADVDAFLELVGMNREVPTFDFESVLPYPENFKALDDERRELEKELGWSKASKEMLSRHGVADGYNSGGYEWCIANWGTKWNASDVVRRDYVGPCVTFQTAWGPPTNVIEALHKRFPMLTLSLEYFERGMDFCGGVMFRRADELDDGEDPKTSWKLKGYRGRRGG